MSAPSDLLLCTNARRGHAPAAPSPVAAIEGGDEVLGPVSTIALAAALQSPALSDHGQTVAQADPAPVKINPTRRTLRFIVPVTDGPTYLGDVTLAVAPDDSLSVQADRLLQMLEPILKPEIFARLKAAAGTRAEISAAALAGEQIRLAYDSDKLALAIGIPVAARRNESMSLRSASLVGQDSLEPASVSGFLNFRSAMDLVERGADRGILAPVSVVDGAIRAAGVVGEGEGYLSFRPGEPRFRRTGSRFVYDDLKDVIRFTLGDVQPFARGFQSTPTVAGISAQRLYNVLEPWREFRSTGSQSFTLFAPSMVETIVNGRSVERKLLQPGNYTLQDFPLAEGANNVRLLIQDEAGKQRTIDFDLYSNQQLLEPGATEFSAFAGVYSTPTDSGIDYSGNWSAFGFVRKGISQQFTAGVNMQADARTQQVGGEVLFGSDFGLMGVELAASRRADGGYGYAGIASFEKVIQSFSGQRSMAVRAAVEKRSSRFATPGALLDREPLAVRASGGFALTLGRDTFVAADAQYARYRVPRSEIYSLRMSGGISITDSMAFIGNLEWNKSRDVRGKIVRIGIRKRLGFRGQVQADVDNHGAVHTSVQASDGVGIGSWSASADLDRTGDGANLNAQGTLLTNRAELGFSQFGGYQADGHEVSDMRTTIRAGTSSPSPTARSRSAGLFSRRSSSPRPTAASTARTSSWIRSRRAKWRDPVGLAARSMATLAPTRRAP